MLVKDYLNGKKKEDLEGKNMSDINILDIYKKDYQDTKKE